LTLTARPVKVSWCPMRFSVIMLTILPEWIIEIFPATHYIIAISKINGASHILVCMK
jgi:hypothetical protein